MSHIEAKISKHPGMGAVVHGQGVTFRVWAPHAKKIYVTGDFNDWKESATPLESEENGYWSGNVTEAKVGDEYRYLIEGWTRKSRLRRGYAEVTVEA